ncbi:hypothetical protein ACWKWK_03580 [Pseudoxanthomonas beigongshangi]
MNLLILEGPPPPPACDHRVFHCRCPGTDALLTGPRACAAPEVRMLLLDSGEIAAHDPALPAMREILDRLPMPYIEVHDDSALLLESRLDLRHPTLATVVFNHDRHRGHALALSVALRRLDAAITVA